MLGLAFFLYNVLLYKGVEMMKFLEDYGYTVLLPLILFIIFLVCFLYAWHCVNKNNDREAKLYYKYALCELITVIGYCTWIYGSNNVKVFYICVITMLFIYLYTYLNMIKFYKKIYIHTGDKRNCLRARIYIILFSLIYIAWSVVLFGKFIYDNSTISMDCIYKDLPEYAWYDIFGTFRLLIELLKMDFDLFNIGIQQLFDPVSNSEWLIFIQSYKWFLGSVSVAIVMNVVLNVTGVSNINWDE